jgi:signal transduction histidine kinase
VSQSHHPVTILVADSSAPFANAFGEAARVVVVDEIDLLARARELLPDVIVLASGAGASAHCEAIRHDELLRGTAILLVDSTEGGSRATIDALRAGADAVLGTPVNRDVLGAQVAALLARRARERLLQTAVQEQESRAARAEAELRAVYRNANQIEAIGRLAGGIAHNFNNLLTVVLVSSELLMVELPEGSPARQHARDAHEAGMRAAALTNQLLAFSRRQMLRPTQLDLNATLANLAPTLGETLGGRIDLTLSPEAGLPPVHVDESQMRRIVLDLAMHARDAMPQGGTLVVETRRVVLTEAYVADHVNVQPGVYVLLAMSDTGVGMDVDTQLHLFEPFYTTRSAAPGLSGLGLSTVYGIVKQSGGYIWVYSEPGRGTTFKIYLPEAGQARTRPAGADGGARALPRGRASVLLVEDEPGVRAVASQVLEGCGYRVVTAGSGEEALERCLGGGLDPDLVITDVVMPGMSGNQLVARLRAARTGLRVLYTSGFSTDAVVHHGVSEDEHFLSKPFTPSDLAHKVREVLGRPESN